MGSGGARNLLVPLTPLYRAALGWREMRLRRGWELVRRLHFPVISVGNLSAGGAGKTPFTIALARSLAARGFAVDVLSRGYGRLAIGAARVDRDGSAEEFGDEPLLITRDTGVPVYVAGQRYDAGLVAEADTGNDKGRPRVHILDDGFQHRQLYRDVDIVLLNREDWEGRLLPAGNLREDLRAAQRAHILVIPHTDTDLERELRAWGWQGPVWRVERRMDVPAVEGPVVAFCGIARPEQFFAGLEAGGLRLAAQVTFRDHHRYTLGDLDRLRAAARAAGATAFVTTPKDEVRLRDHHSSSGTLASADGSTPPWRPTLLTNDVKVREEEGRACSNLPFFTAGLRTEIRDEAKAMNWLAGRLAGTAARQSL